MKRIWTSIVLLAAALLVAGCAHPLWSGWITLIDGERGLENFDRIGDANWRAEEGAIVADKGRGSSHLVTKDLYKDFEIVAEFWADTTTNSGIFLRAGDGKGGGKWNTIKISAKGPNITVDFNGVRTVSLEGSKFAAGPFTLQFANGPKDAPGGPIRWRKVMVRPL